MSTRRPTFAVDLDGVCCDYFGAIRDMLAAEQSLPFLELCKTYSMSEYFADLQEHHVAHTRAIDAGMWRTMNAIPGAAAGIAQIQAAGIRVVVATARGNFGEAPAIARAHTEHWLAAHGITVDAIHFGSPKHGVDADLFVDDSPKEIEALREASRPVIIFDQEYNRHLVGRRAKDWSELAPMVIALLTQLVKA